MNSFQQQQDFFSDFTTLKQNVNASPEMPWYSDDNLSDCSMLPSPICEDVTTPISNPTDFWDPSNFNDCDFSSMSLFPTQDSLFQTQDWLSDQDQDFKMPIATPQPKLASIDPSELLAQSPVAYPASSSSQSSKARIARDFSQDLSLSESEVKRLSAIAWGHTSPTLTPSSPSSSATGTPKSEVTTPRQSASRKRGRPSNDESASKKCKTQKSSHNQIEKKYRTNLNSKIAELRDCIPELRALCTGSEEDESDDRVNISKAKILSAAIEHINMLQRNLNCQKQETQVLRSIVTRLHPKLIDSVGGQYA